MIGQGRRTKPSGLLRTLIGLIVLALLAGGCVAAPVQSGQPSASQVPPTAGATAQPTAKPMTAAELAAAAQAEGGQLMIYTSMNVDDLESVLKEFKTAYPFVKAEYYRASGEDVIARAMTEAQAGQHFADVFETNAFEVYRLMQAGLLDPYDAPERAAYPNNAKDPAGYWTVDRINLIVIAYNTDLVKGADVPKGYDDLLNPKWKGKIAVEPGDVELFADMVGAWGDTKTKTFWQGLAAQQPQLVSGHTELAQFLVAGDFALSPTVYGHRVTKLKDDGAPIDWVKTDPVFAFTQLLAYGNRAPHPATGKLFVNWLLSEAGQKAIKAVKRVPARPGIDKVLQGLNPYYTVPSLAEHYNDYLDAWKQLGFTQK